MPELEERIGRAQEKLRSGKKVLETAAGTVRAETAALKARVRQDLADFTARMRDALAAELDKADADDIRRYLSFFVQDTWKAWTEAEGEQIAAELERLAEEIIQVANENIRDVARAVTARAGAGGDQGRDQGRHAEVRRVGVRAGRARHDDLPVRQHAGRAAC